MKPITLVTIYGTCAYLLGILLGFNIGIKSAHAETLPEIQYATVPQLMEKYSVGTTEVSDKMNVKGKLVGKHKQKPLKIIKKVQPPKQTLFSTVTAYTAVETCGSHCTMASGKQAYVGAAACPRRLALGTKILINGTQYTCEDRTALRVDGRFDLFFGYTQSDYQRAIQFGKQHLEVIIL